MTLKILSLGWGTQSFTLAAMSALGEIEPVDLAIHADTTHERTATYAFAKHWTPWLEERGVKVVTVKNPQPNEELMSFKTDFDLPAFTDNGESLGQLNANAQAIGKSPPCVALSNRFALVNPLNNGSASVWTNFSA